MTAAKSSKTVRNRGCAETAAAVRDGSLTAVECANAALEEIVERDGELGAFLEVFSDDVLEDARQIDLESHENRAALPLAGVPIALKDNICVAGHRTTAAPRFSNRGLRPTPPRSSIDYAPPEPLLWARRTSTSSPWGRQPRIRRYGRNPSIRTTYGSCSGRQLAGARRHRGSG